MSRLSMQKRPRKRLDSKSVIGVDLGGSQVRLAYVTPKGQRAGAILCVPVTARGQKAVLALLVDTIRRIQASGPRPLALGVGIPGFIQMEKGKVYRSPNFPDWRDVPIQDLLQSRLPVPVIIENDANAAAFGESWVGCGEGVESLIYLGLGTGVGGGVVLDRKVWRGMDGIAGELGHITVDPNGPLCGCGNHGCLESYASATAIVRRYREMRGHASDGLTSHDIALRARQGDRKARAVFVEAGRALGIAIADLLNIFDPERIAIGGGVAGAWPLFYRSMMAEAARRAIRPLKLSSKIKRGSLKNEAGIIGAAGLAYHRLGFAINPS